MAIGFVRSRYVSRSTGGNACRSSAYNSRTKITDEKTNETYDFTKRGGNVYHEVLLPSHVDEKFKNITFFSNSVELAERRKDSQLYIEWILALPKEEAVTLAMKKELIHRFIEYKGWLTEGLGVQIDIHEPDEEDINWHAHLLFTTRKFSKEGTALELLKARDLQPKVSKGKVVEETEDNIAFTAIQNEYFKECGLDLKVDLPGELTQKHIGPVRMRKVLSETLMRNEERKVANIKNLKNGEKLIELVTKYTSVFTITDLVHAAKIVPDVKVRERLIEEALQSKSLVNLYYDNGNTIGYFTTKKVRLEEKKLLRLSEYVHDNENIITKNSRKYNIVKNEIEALVKPIDKSSISSEEKRLSNEQYEALKHIMLDDGGLRILRGRAGVGKSHVLGKLKVIADIAGINVIGIAPTHKARCELLSKGYKQNDTIRGFLYKIHNNKIYLPTGSLLVVDEAGMVGNDDYTELLRVAASRKCNVILAGDERQLASVQRGGMFEIFTDRYGSSLIGNIIRQKEEWARTVAMCFANHKVGEGVGILREQGRLITDKNFEESMHQLLEDWANSDETLENKLIIAVRNKDVMALNHGAREYLKSEGKITGEEISVNGHHYAKGDRILIKETNKDLGIINGEFAEILSVSKRQFIISMKKGNTANDNKHILKFNPKLYSGFSHGYAATIYKAQAASINMVYIFHSGFAGIRNSYVALSRCVKDMRLYINSQTTWDIGCLIRQLSHDPERGSSLVYSTQEEINQREKEKNVKTKQGIFKSLVNSVAKYTGEKIMRFADKHLPVSDYYRFEETKIKSADIEKVINEIAIEMGQKAVNNSMYINRQHYAETKVVGSSNVIKDEFYQSDEIPNEQKLVNASFIGSNSNISKVQNTNQGQTLQNQVVQDLFIQNNNYQENKNKQIDTIVKENSKERINKQQISIDEDLKQSHLSQANQTIQNTEKLQNPLIISPQTIKEIPVKKSASSKFYARADKFRRENDRFEQMQARKDEWNRESERLRHEVKFKAEQISRNLLGEPNPKYSNSKELRWGKTGSMVLNIKGETAGIWKDFSTDEAGDIFSLVQHKMRCDFKGAAEYLRSYVGRSSITSLKLVNDYRNQEMTAKYIQEQEAKEKKAQNLFARAKDITEQSIAYKYLSQKRGINCELSTDIKTADIYQFTKQLHEENTDTKAVKGTYYPALIAFVRNKDGKITGWQHILLDKHTTGKADLEIAKRSFGKISGSFVDIGNINNNKIEIVLPKDNNNTTEVETKNINQITIIAEGLETALSVKQALSTDKSNKDMNIKILCSLGISNIRNYPAKNEEKIIIAADNDGKHAITNKTIEKAAFDLKAKGAFVEVVKPYMQGDFNDVLKQSVSGEKEIQKIFIGAITRYKAKTLAEYFDVKTDINKQNNIDNNKEINKLVSKEHQYKSLEKDCNFLLKHQAVPESKLLKQLKKTDNIKIIKQSIFKQCRDLAYKNINYDISVIKTFDKANKENEAIKMIFSKRKDHQDYALYLKDTSEEAAIKHFTNRVKAEEIYLKHQQKEPLQAQRFKYEMQAMNRFNKLNIIDTLKIYQEKGIEKATDFAYAKNSEYVINKLESRNNILKLDTPLKGREYITAIAKDNQIMSYVDKAISSGKRFIHPAPLDNRLTDYAKERDNNKELNIAADFKTKDQRNDFEK